jgi:multidrug efflux pump subunit AcrB
LLALAFPALSGWAWPMISIANVVLPMIGQPPLVSPSDADGTTLAIYWICETAAEFALGFLLTRYGNQVYWVLDRFILGPVLLRPTEWCLERLTIGYGRLLRWSLVQWKAVLAVSAALIAVAVVMLYYDVLGRELVPSEDQSRFLVHVVCPVGSSIEQIDDLLRECEDRLVERDDVAKILTTVATEPGQLMNEADIFVMLTPHAERKLRQRDIIQQVRAELESIKDIRVVVRDQSTEGFTAQRGDPVDFAIQGDWERLPDLAKQITDEMAASGMVQDIDSDFRPGMPEVRVRPLRDKLAAVNSSVGKLADTVSLSVGGQRVAKFTDRGRRYDVRVRLLRQDRGNLENLEPLTLRSGQNRLVPVSDVAYVETVSTLPVINRFNHRRKIEITASPVPGVSQGEAIAKCQEIAERILPEGFTVVELGNAQAMRDTMQSLVFALVMGVIIAYMILGVQFNSFVHPFTVLLAMPFAVTGALVTLWLTGDTLNMMSMIGLILLMGLVKKNSIILVDYTNQLRNEGKSIHDAVLTACPVRLRPILMTSIATIAGAIPAAFGWGPGAETRAPMARGIIGGIVLSTLVTLVLVPVFYVLVERMRRMSGKFITAPPADNASLPASTPAPAAVAAS